MIFPLEKTYRDAILRQYEKNMSRYPRVKRDVDDFLQDEEETFCLCLKYLYGHMAAQDVLSADPQVLADFVRTTLKAWEKIPFLKTVPPEVFFPYVLYHRVNSECLDDSRGWLYEQLLPFVCGKNMEQAALAVNYWCYAHATYTPADERTLGPLAVIRRTLGRCGEESVLAVSALRSVGIPARQCYCPRWSHCDDNHAWVEVWIDGAWHYLGACEPEPVLDRGWFTAAASRAMRVDTKCWADWTGDRLYETVNCVSRYTPARILTVQVMDQGAPLPGTRVAFQILNYSELFTLWETETDENGLARFETGAGDLFVFAQLGEKMALEKVDLRRTDAVTMELAPALPERLTADLVPPADCSGTVPYPDNPAHRALLAQCETHLAKQRSVFEKTEGYFQLAARNREEIQAFLESGAYSLPQKEELLRTLRPKDFVDITTDTLLDALDTAEAARGQYPEEIFRDYILAPRIADEMLLPQRRNIRELFPQGFENPCEILAWMEAALEVLPDEGIDNYWPSAYACLRYRQVPGFAFDMVFVALCRAFCFPARLEPRTKAGQWLDDRGIWRNIRPTPAEVRLTVNIPCGKKLNYFEHFTLGQWNGRDYVTLQYPDLSLAGSYPFSVRPGRYRITVTTRQIDGTASGALWHLCLSGDTTLDITVPEDQTPRRLKQIPLVLPDGSLKALLEAQPNRNLLLMFTDPGSEPTEHLLTEMLDCGAEFRKRDCRMLLLAEKTESLNHPTVKRLLDALPMVEAPCHWDPEALAALYRQMQVGDLRLPFVVCIDRLGNGVFADANYRIRLAQTLLEIQKLLEH